MKIVNATEHELHELIRQGLDLPEIKKRTNVSMSYLLRSFTTYIKENSATNNISRIGNKDEPYFSDESKMKIPEYIYESLSESEKVIYDELPEQQTVGNTIVSKSKFLARLKKQSKFI